MFVRILQDIIIAYGPTRLFKGDTIELPADVAQKLITDGQAEVVKKKPAVRKVKAVPEQPTIEPTAENSAESDTSATSQKES